MSNTFGGGFHYPTVGLNYSDVRNVHDGSGRSVPNVQNSEGLQRSLRLDFYPRVLFRVIRAIVLKNGLGHKALRDEGFPGVVGGLIVSCAWRGRRIRNAAGEQRATDR